MRFLARAKPRRLDKPQQLRKSVYAQRSSRNSETAANYGSLGLHEVVQTAAASRSPEVTEDDVPSASWQTAELQAVTARTRHL